MKKPILVGQLSWPVPVDSWLNCRAQFEWTKALTDLKDQFDVSLVGTNPEFKEFETEKDGCRMLFSKPENHASCIRRLRPDVMFWNDFPLITRDWIPEMPYSKHIMRMHGDWRMFHSCWDVLRKSWKVVVPMVADPIVCKAFGIENTVRIKFGVDVPEMQGGKPWSEREIHFASPARDVPKGSEVMDSVFHVLRKLGYRCESNCWLPRDKHREMIQNTKVFWVPSAHECISRTATEAAVAGCHLVACSESPPMVEQIGLQGGSVVSTDLLYDIPNRKWSHRRNPELIAKDLERLLSKPAVKREDWSEWDVSKEVELLRELFIEALPIT